MLKRNEASRLPGMPVPYEMYFPRKPPIAVNALLRPLASVVIPAVAAKATRARIKRYSTRP